MEVKVVKIKAHYFPLDMRCSHVSQGRERKCDRGCYVLEKGGDAGSWTCKANDCEGHAYVGEVKKDDEGIACFGKSKMKMVCIEK